MHSRELVELAAILSAQGPVLVRQTRGLPPKALQQYWTASKCRLDRWARNLKSFTSDTAGPPGSGKPTAARAQWPFMRSVLEEILTGEVLTRVWTAVLCLCDRRQGTQEAENIARSIMIGHLEARHRVLMLLVRGPGVDAEAAVKLNHLRRRTERWTDLLVGYLAGMGDVGEFAFDQDRARDFAQDLSEQGKLPGGHQAWPLILASLRAGFQQGLAPASPNEDLNAAIASAILSCLNPDLFDATGLFRSLWLARLTSVANDVQGMIDNLLGPEQPARAEAQLGRRMRRFGRE
jgi:hypothetical protein